MFDDAIESEEWANAHAHPAAFAEYLSTREKFMRPPHVDLLSETIAKSVIGGGDGRFIVTMPPRHGKSTICSQWLPFWFLNLFPYKNVMIVSYGSEFAKKWGLRVRRLAAVHRDRTMMRLSPDSKSAGEWETTQGGGMKSVGIDGDATGRGADLLIIDDPVKNAKEARSEVVQESNWDAWRETFRTRVEPRGTVLVVQTRWHESDLAGKLLDADQDPDDEDQHRWTRIDFPAIAEGDDVLGRTEGEALWPERYPIEVLEEIRDAKDGVGTRGFASLYQQRPTPEGGGMFRRKDFRYYKREGTDYVLRTTQGDHRVSIASCRHFQACDTAMTEKVTSDFTVITTFAQTPRNHLLIVDVRRDRLEVPDQWPFLMAAIRNAKVLGNYLFTTVEDKASGIGLIQTAKRMGVPIRAAKADRDKVTRATPVATWFEAGMAYFNEDDANLGATENELLVFPNGANDDIVDTIAHGFNEMRRLPDPSTAKEYTKPTERERRGAFADMIPERMEF